MSKNVKGLTKRMRNRTDKALAALISIPNVSAAAIGYVPCEICGREIRSGIESSRVCGDGASANPKSAAPGDNPNHAHCGKIYVEIERSGCATARTYHRDFRTAEKFVAGIVASETRYAMEALAAIAQALSGREWNGDACDTVAGIVRALGFDVKDVASI